MYEDLSAKNQPKDSQMRKNSRKESIDGISAWNEFSECTFFQKKLPQVIRNTALSPTKCISRNISPLRDSKNKPSLAQKPISICFSSYTKVFNREKKNKFARYWEKRCSPLRAKDFRKSSDFCQEFKHLSTYRLNTDEKKSKRNRNNSPIFAFLPQIDVCKATLSKRNN